MIKFLSSLLLSFLIFFSIFRYSLGDIDKSIINNPSKLIYKYPCEDPITYRIGTIDKRFQTTKDKFIINAEQAANIWNKNFNQVIFKYEEQNINAVTINMVYDERQSMNTQITNLENKLESSEQNLKPQITAHESKAKEFEKRLALFNADVKKWNEQGGAPPEVYEKLNSEFEELEKIANSLNETSANLNISTNKFNQQVGQLKNSIKKFNEVLKYKPEQGIFDPVQNKIDIYFNNNQKELIHTLAHELGHAIGIKHQDDEKSIMFPLTTEVLTPTIDELDTLSAICKKQNVFKILEQRIQINYSRINQN